MFSVKFRRFCYINYKGNFWKSPFHLVKNIFFVHHGTDKLSRMVLSWAFTPISNSNLDFYDTSMKTCTLLGQGILNVSRNKSISNLAYNERFSDFELYIISPSSESPPRAGTVGFVNWPYNLSALCSKSMKKLAFHFFTEFSLLYSTCIKAIIKLVRQFMQVNLLVF